MQRMRAEIFHKNKKQGILRIYMFSKGKAEEKEREPESAEAGEDKRDKEQILREAQGRDIGEGGEKVMGKEGDDARGREGGFGEGERKEGNRKGGKTGEEDEGGREGKKEKVKGRSNRALRGKVRMLWGEELGGIDDRPHKQ